MKKNCILTLLSACFFIITGHLSAQFQQVEIGVNGLTCSQCTRSVEFSIRKLDFVKDVLMDLEHTNGKITFNTGKKVEIEKIAQAIENAGFSVRFIKADFIFDMIVIDNGSCFIFENRSYQFVKVNTNDLKGVKQIKFIGKEFMPQKEYKLLAQQLKPKCNEVKTPLFYITLE